MLLASNLEKPEEKQCFCSPRASILDPSYTYVNKGSPPSLVLFEIIIFKMLAAGPGAHVLKGPAASILKMMISEVAHPFRSGLGKQVEEAWVNR